MILGVVLGNIAELNLARAFAITTDLSPFVTRPWSLFFLIAAVFSAFFPFYQASRGRRKWTLFYAPLLMLAVSAPMFMMTGWVRPPIGGILLAGGVYGLYGAYRASGPSAAGGVTGQDQADSRTGGGRLSACGRAVPRPCPRTGDQAPCLAVFEAVDRLKPLVAAPRPAFRKQAHATLDQA